MKIISVRRGFTSDHSSTSYEFLAADKPLGAAARAAVSRLSRRANPTGRRVSFIYHAEGYSLPGGWEPLMREYYDVMYSESYDWWTFALAFDASPEQRQAISQYEFEGSDGLGVSVACHDDRVIVTVSCRVDAGALPRDDRYRGYDDYGEEEDEEEEEAGERPAFESENGLLNLLARVRHQLMQGDYRPLYAVWEVYGWDEDEADEEEEERDVPPVPADPPAGREVAKEFAALLAEE